MEQTNVIMLPTQPPASERLRLYHDDSAIIFVLAAVRARNRDPYVKFAQARIGSLDGGLPV
jgi:hypothetical protein